MKRLAIEKLKMNKDKVIEQLQSENSELLLECAKLKNELGGLKNLLGTIDEYRVLKEFEGDLRGKAEELLQGTKDSIKSLKTQIFGF